MPVGRSWHTYVEVLFTLVRGRQILRRSLAGPCINRPPETRGWLLRDYTLRAGAPRLISWRRMKMQVDAYPRPRMGASDRPYCYGLREPDDPGAPPSVAARKLNGIAHSRPQLYEMRAPPVSASSQRLARSLRSNCGWNELPSPSGPRWRGSLPTFPAVHQARYAMAGQRGTNLKSLDHAEDESSEVHVGGNMRLTAFGGCLLDPPPCGPIALPSRLMPLTSGARVEAYT